MPVTWLAIGVAVLSVVFFVTHAVRNRQAEIDLAESFGS